MWYAITAHPIKRSKKHERKEFSAFTGEVFLSAESLESLQGKIRESLSIYPEQTRRYLQAGIKFVEAESAAEAKEKSLSLQFYFTDTNQYGFF